MRSDGYTGVNPPKVQKASAKEGQVHTARGAGTTSSAGPKTHQAEGAGGTCSGGQNLQVVVRIPPFILEATRGHSRVEIRSDTIRRVC